MSSAKDGGPMATGTTGERPPEVYLETLFGQ